MSPQPRSNEAATYLPSDPVDAAEIEPFSPELYGDVGLNQLLAYAVSYLEGRRYRGTIENITVVTYRMFPNKYSLVGYPQFPDSARVQRVILHLGPKYVGLLEGKNKIGYRLNERGRSVAAETALRLSAPSAKRDKESLAPGFWQDNIANRTAVDTRIPRIRNSE